LAGYHWFTDWGRDTMITMLGATISLGKSTETISIMSTFLKYLDKGMVPNRFPDREHEEPEYNTVDGTLWLFVAVHEYYQKFKDEEFLKAMYPFLGEILLHHIDGTRYNIHATADGMLWAGDATTQLTWMDVKIGDHVVTPRYGSPVEINALWYNALKIYDFITQHTHQKADVEVGEIIKKFEANFEKFFWNEGGYLNDVYYENGKFDGSIRPNQLYAVSLPFTLLDKEKQKMVCATAEKHLLTRLGMRTLAPSHPSFKPKYEGNTWSRDTAYHQGTVWPFLTGEFMMAYLKAHDFSADAKIKCKEIIDGFQDHFYNNTGIHCISEILDGQDPKEGKGCINQAWSVGALIRVLDKADLLTK
ncbi:MAG: glycogen debranching protein, partial [Cytophagaceae bacterium]|nr:glycogen debranching protein [Cytophagaceae bacterium]